MATAVIVEGDPADRQRLFNLCRQSGYQRVEVFLSPDSLIRRFQFDSAFEADFILLCDGRNAQAALTHVEALRSLKPMTPLVVLSRPMFVGGPDVCSDYRVGLMEPQDIHLAGFERAKERAEQRLRA